MKKLELYNFKCFVNNKIKFTPLTILTGINAAGKSSIIQALLLFNAAAQKGEKVLDLDVSSNVRWAEYSDLLPYCKLTQTAMSERILQSVKQKMKEATWPEHPEFEYMYLSEQEYSLPEEQYDVIVCDHLFLRGLQMEKMLESCQKALKPGGRILVSAIGYNHMKELIELVKNLDPRIHFYNMDSLYYLVKRMEVKCWQNTLRIFNGSHMMMKL